MRRSRSFWIILGICIAGYPDPALEAKDASGGMALISAGAFTPLYPDPKESKPWVPAFRLDLYPVTNEDFLNFVTENPQWQRSRIKPIFADASYLKRWNANLKTGDRFSYHAPVTFVSWFAANAYCRWKKKRLPSVDEWEYAASHYEVSLDEIKDRILGWYERPSSAKPKPVGSTFKNKWGVYDLHGLVWEWTSDFNSSMISDESQLFCGGSSAGSSDTKDYAAFMRYAFRSSLEARYSVGNLGFRCASEAKSEDAKSEMERQ